MSSTVASVILVVIFDFVSLLVMLGADSICAVLSDGSNSVGDVGRAQAHALIFHVESTIHISDIPNM